ncbi:helix-turn-helix domain-containing protein [Streptomyces erythrochromogenes]|uniref:helix-turn-helix domain-containing protein n=1 Tax=Streptomyces erythrochromogenes TaxID=285574 RepID=UPI00362D78CA
MHDRDQQQAREAARPSPLTPAERLGMRIAAMRIDANLTQEKLFLAAGISRNTYQRIEAGTGDARYSHLLRIATVLRCHVRDLIP